MSESTQAIRVSFSAEEWRKVMEGPGNAGAAVMAASPSGMTGILAEMKAIAGATREGPRVQEPRPALLDAIAADLKDGPAAERVSPKEREMLAQLGELLRGGHSGSAG